MTIDEKIEFEILQFLNDRIENFNITREILKTAVHKVPEDRFRKALNELCDRDYVDTKDSNPNGWTITTDGQLEYNLRKELIEEQKNKHIPKDPFSSEEVIELNRKLDFIIVDLNKKGLGQEIIFDEINSLRDLIGVGKKNWFILLMGKVMMEVAKAGLEKAISDKIIKSISDVFHGTIDPYLILPH